MFHHTKNISIYRNDIYTHTHTHTHTDSIEPEPSAPPAPWYYYRYPMEVIAKAHIVLEKTWNYLPLEHQTHFLEFYLHRYNNNDL